MTYQPIYKPNQIILGTGAPVIVTGWTPIKKVASMLTPDQYAAIGHLYSASRGINFFVRNFLANPQVNSIVLVDTTKEDRNSGSVKCLFDFLFNGFKKGIHHETGQPKWVINSEIIGYIDIEVSEESLSELWQLTSAFYVSNMDHLKDKVQAAINWHLPPSRSRQVFPMAEPESPVVPGALYGHRIEAKTIAEGWIKLIHRIRTTGKLRPTGYDGQWQELIDLMVIVTDEPEDFYFPGPNYLPVTREFLAEYIPQITTDNPTGTKYTYGQRLRSWFKRDQIEQVITKLVGEIDAASAVMSLWDVEDHEKGGSPCLNHIWLRVVDGSLSMTATFRSNDMFSAWPSNVMGLRALQRHILDEINKRSELNLSIGALITISQSAHIYEDCFENADSLIKNQYQTIVNKRDYFDPAGNFVVSTTDSMEIVVEWLTPDSSTVVKEYRGRKALKLSLDIARDCPSMTVENALYLGRKLQEAEYALR